MSDQENNGALALEQRRTAVAERRTILALDGGLVAAYHGIRGSNELLRILDSGGGRFTEAEREVIHTAHRHVHLAFECLNQIVEDDGNVSNRANRPT